MYPSLQRAGAGATLAKLHLRMSLPALALTGVLGIALVGMSDDVFSMSQTWVVLALIAWVILMVVSWFMIRPAITDSSDAARGRLASGIGISHLLLVVLLYLMVFKPGSERPVLRAVGRYCGSTIGGLLVGRGVEGDRHLAAVGTLRWSSSGLRPAAISTLSLISTMISGFSARKSLAFSRPWPSCSPS